MPPIEEAQADGENWLTGWSYRRAITINNTGTAISEDFQVIIDDFDTATLVTASKMRSDGYDIRFTRSNGSTVMPYWVESGMNTSTTDIWVKITADSGVRIPNGDSTIYMYYGKSDETTEASNGSTTFEFFDDFEGAGETTAFYPTGWTKSGSNPLKDFGTSQAWFGACYNDYDSKFYLYLQTDSLPNSTIECWSFTKANAEIPANWVNEGTIYTLSEAWEGSWIEPHSVIFETQAMADSRRDIEDPGGAPHSGSTRKWRLYYCADSAGYETGFLLASETDMTSWTAYSGNPVYVENTYGYPDCKAVVYNDEVWMVIGEYTKGAGCLDAYFTHSSNGINNWTDESSIGCEWLLGQPITVGNGMVTFKHENSDTELHEGYTEDGESISLYSSNPIMTGSGAGAYDQRIEWLAVAHTKDYTSKIDGYYYLWYIGLGADSSHHQMCLAKTQTVTQETIKNLDTNKWTKKANADVTISNGIATLKSSDASSSGIYTKVYSHSADGVIIEYQGKRGTSASGTRFVGSMSDVNAMHKGAGGLGYYALNQGVKCWNYAGTSNYPTGTIDNIFYDMTTYLKPTEIVITGAGLTATIANTLASYPIGVGIPDQVGWYMKNFRVRKYASPEPSASVGNETALPTIHFTSASSSGAESVTPAQLELSLSGASGQDVTVDYSATGGTASGSGTDYTLANGTATITAGNTTTTVNITIVNDSLDETNETIEVTVSNPSNATLGANTVHTYTIEDDDDAPSVSFTNTPYNHAETGSQTISATISSVSGKEVSVNYASSDSTATAGSDYTATNGTLTWSISETGEKTFNVVILEDDIDEDNETVNLTLSSPSNCTISGVNPVSLNITDNDTAGITVNPTSGLTTTEAGGAAGFTIVLDTQPTADVSIGLSSSDTSEGTVLPASLTFTSGNWSVEQNVTVTGVDDSVDDADIGYTIVTAAASSTDPNYNNLDASDVSITNTDDDEPAPSGGGGGMPAEWHNPPAPPSQGFSILINDDAQFTNILTVTLNLRGGSDAKRMAISNFSDFRDIGQELYNTTKEWNLCKGKKVCEEREYIVYAKFYTQYGQPSPVVFDSIIYQKEKVEEEKPIIIKVPEEIKKISEEAKKISEKAKEIVKKIAEVFKPKPIEITQPEIPIEELVPEQTPLVFQSKYNLLTYTLENKPFTKFTLAPLPREIRVLAQKFPEFGETLKKVGITKITDIEKLRTVKLTLPGLTERMGLPTTKVEPGKLALPIGVPIANLSPQIKKQIPSEIVFAKGGGELIDFNITLTVSEKGEPEQKITTISGKPLQLVVKPEKPVKSVKGYLVFKSKKPRPSSFQFPLNRLAASLIFASPVFAYPQEKPVRIKERLVMLEFEYTDPDNDGIYTAEIQAPLVEGEYEIITVMDFEDPRLGTKEIRLITVVDPEGYVFEKYGDKETRIPGAIVSIYWLNLETKQYELWPATEYQQENPQITNATGKYSFLVPEGSYCLKVEAPGYLIYNGKPFQVKEGSGVHINIELKTKYWWLKIVDWKTILLILVIILLFYNFYRDRIRERIMKKES